MSHLAQPLKCFMYLNPLHIHDHHETEGLLLAFQNGICIMVTAKNYPHSRAQWLTSVIPALGEAKVGGSPEDRSLRPA